MDTRAGRPIWVPTSVAGPCPSMDPARSAKQPPRRTTVPSRIASLLIAGCALSAAAAAEPDTIDLATAVKDFQLPESSRTAKQLIPGWVAPRKIVVVVDKPERTAWLQASMPSGVSVLGV